MNRANISFFLPFLMIGTLCADAPQPIGPISMGGGLNVATLATQIPDEDSPDLCNCLPVPIGSMSKRNGTQRFISQAISSNPVTSIQRVYASTVSWNPVKMMVGSSYDKIMIATSDVNPVWTIISSGNSNQHYNYVTMNNKVIIAGDALTENVRQYDIANSTQLVLNDAFSTWGSTNLAGAGANPRGKYQIVANNYYVLANIQMSVSPQHLAGQTTYYASRLMFSFLNNFSSMTVSRYIDYNTVEGEEITGVGSIYGGNFKNGINVFKPNSIGELSWTNALDLPSLGGDYQFTEVVKGFGCIASRTLVTAGLVYVFLAKDGVRIWDGGRQGRLDQTQSSRIISGDIKPMIDDLIRSGRYKSAVGVYYSKKEQYWLSFENGNRFPKGKNNYVLVYDFRIGKWYPLCNINAESFTVADNQTDSGQLYYGDSNDGYVHMADVETRQDDSRKEISLDVMDSTPQWKNSTQDIVNVREGTASVKVSITGLMFSTEITKMGVLNLGEWYDKTRVSINDKLSFKAYANNITSITSLRVDFEVKNVTGSFDTNFSSLTISSSAFLADKAWTTFEISLSSFPVRPDWIDLAVETVTFYNRFNAYGLRFVLTGVDTASVSIDDIRIVGQSDNPNRMYRFTKLYDFQSPALKGFGQVLLLMDKSQDASFSIDIYNDFGQKIRTENIPAEVPKEVLLFHANGVPGFSFLNSSDLSTKKSTQTTPTNWDCFNGVMDDNKIVCADQGPTHERILSFDRANTSTFTAFYGTFGSGTSNFNMIHEISQFPGGYLISDLYNQRTKIHAYSNLGFLKQYGQLGNGSTNYHDPSGVAANGSNFFVSDESNNRLLKLDQSSFAVAVQVAVDHNIIADSSLALSDKNLFMAYNNLSPTTNDVIEIFLEKRDIGNLDLLQRVTVRPKGVNSGFYKMSGSIGLLGKYIFISFNNETDDDSLPVTYYLQKRLQSNFDLVSEYSSSSKFYGVAGYSLAFNPITKTRPVDLKVEGRYIQLKFYDNDLDNFWRLYQMTPLTTIQPITY